MTANCASICGEESTLAPTSTITAGLPLRVGKALASAGRSTPGIMPMHRLGDGHDGAGIAGGDESIGLAVAHQAGGDADRGVALGADGLGGAVVHGDDLAGVDDFDGQAAPAVVFRQLRLEDVLLTDEDHVDVLAPGGAHGAVDFRRGRVVASHCVDSDGDHEGESVADVYSAGDFDDFAAFVLTAVRAGAVRQLHFVALGALGEPGALEGVVGAALSRATIAVASFRIGHLNSSLGPVPRSRTGQG